MRCETCSTDIASVDIAHSMVIVLQKVALDGYSYYQCESGIEHGGLTFQHFHCNHQEMIAGVKACINLHYQEPYLTSPEPGNVVRLHRTVLRAQLNCKVCGSKLTTQAYRFCLTHATPLNSVPDDSQNELGEWCCSLAHARQSVVNILEG